MREKWKDRTRERWEEERREFFGERGMGIDEVEGKGGEERDWFGELEKWDKERQRRERRDKIGQYITGGMERLRGMEYRCT